MTADMTGDVHPAAVHGLTLNCRVRRDAVLTGNYHPCTPVCRAVHRSARHITAQLNAGSAAGGVT
ncbi:hypothetical protein ACK87B_004901, partial [Salmonella enterica]